ncbi:LacI family DNA-binding transcriptional regulator [Deinococcus maricopensis]|uniref:Transcriptional regulator, LacI family n=1 Tax=Deinococcus maricopensis (strain DSM 21211 / LMG 22137 / NRRL B-23946 / LB-34) TaxID=709986 RepID=E8U487_DEIML|nr:LacI family DNA-binding transcriptional regulator [Deinococcus maricopensis]ADV65924.1 transcriptional regulator, LacI family [Deinococcus maricopensis DSM 21211]
MSKAITRNATITDVAKLAGVSYQTVSRVINDHPSVAPATRERVQNAIDALNYRPSLVAKSLVTRRTQLIGVVAYGTDQYGPAQIVQNVERAAREYGYEILLTTLHAFATAEMQANVQRLMQFGVDGVVLLTPFQPQMAVDAVGGSLPYILIDANEKVEGSSVIIDQFEGACQATTHLLDLGHERILHVSGPVEWSDAELRHQGYVHALERARLEPLPRLIGDWSARSGHEAVQRALQDGLPFTAVFAGNDQMALGAIAALHASGRRVPEDVSVVGFDNTPESAFFSPALTTVHQNFAALGRKSMDNLMRVMRDPERPARQYILQPQLIVRQSTGPAPR